MSKVPGEESRKRILDDIVDDADVEIESPSPTSPSHLLRSLCSFQVTKVVGQGTFGVVFKAIDRICGEQVALKKIKMEKETQGFPITAIREIKILKALHHKNIVNLREIVTFNQFTDNDAREQSSSTGLTHDDVFMVFDYCDFDLSGLLRYPKIAITLQHAKSYTKQILDGVYFMHLNDILHRDIKAANIFVKNNVIKIGDFGLAKPLNRNAKQRQRLSPTVVTQWYRCPELILGSCHYGPEIDMWSVGCLFFEIRGTSHNPLFRGIIDNEQSQLETIYQVCGSPDEELSSRQSSLPGSSKYSIAKNYERTLHKLMSYDPLALDLLSKLVELDPDKRIDAKEALVHDYFLIDPPVDAQHLPQFNLGDDGFALATDERIRGEWQKQAEQRQQQAAAASSSKLKAEQTGAGGAGGGAAGAMPRGRIPTAQAKIKIIRPVKAGAASSAAAAAAGGGVVAGVTAAAPHSATDA